jgi:CheY-like chemotaxis protein
MKSVLIVEDDKWLAEQYARVLGKAGYKTVVTLNALDAITAIDDKLPDVIILDVLLTGSTAFAFLNELQSYGDTGVIPVILCTSIASDLMLEDLMPYGVKEIIDKTVMVPEDLVISLRRLYHENN